MKTKRQNQILKIISECVVETQEELIERLKEAGYPVTQATISRDIKELKLIKAAVDKNKYRYIRSGGGDLRQNAKYDYIIQETVTSVNICGHLVVVRTYNGMAMAACAALDSMGWEGVVGTIAGDDTIFIAVKTEKNANDISTSILSVIKNK